MPKRYVDIYEVIELLGQGGVGAAYKARSVGGRTRKGTLVCLKRVSDNVSAERSEIADRSLQHEVRVVAPLRHDNIAALLDYGTDHAGGTFLAFELVEGCDLASMLSYLRPGTLRPSAAIYIVKSVCRALAYAHEQGVIHRDVKPSNILISKDAEVKLTDFGVAKIQDHTRSAVTKGIGSPEFFAPEQIMRTAVSPSTDCFSLATVFYQCLTGRLPFYDHDPAKMLANMRERRFRHNLAEADVPADWVDGIYQGLSFDPASRYVSAGAFLSMMESATDLPVDLRTLGELAQAVGEARSASGDDFGDESSFSDAATDYGDEDEEAAEAAERAEAAGTHGAGAPATGRGNPHDTPTIVVPVDLEVHERPTQLVDEGPTQLASYDADTVVQDPVELANAAAGELPSLGNDAELEDLERVAGTPSDVHRRATVAEGAPAEQLPVHEAPQLPRPRQRRTVRGFSDLGETGPGGSTLRHDTEVLSVPTRRPSMRAFLATAALVAAAGIWAAMPQASEVPSPASAPAAAQLEAEETPNMVDGERPSGEGAGAAESPSFESPADGAPGVVATPQRQDSPKRAASLEPPAETDKPALRSARPVKSRKSVTRQRSSADKSGEAVEVVVGVMPQADQVRIDGIARGPAPVRVKLRPGRHRVVASFGDIKHSEVIVVPSTDGPHRIIVDIRTSAK